MQCPACGNRSVAGLFDQDHVASVYDDSYFFGGGAGYSDYLSEAQLLRDQGRRYGELLSRHSKNGRLLEVGSAAGFLQAGMEDAGWATTGLDPNQTMVSHARDTLGLNALQGSLEDCKGLEPFDAVSLIQVIGHFHDLPKAMKSVADLTRPGGICVIEYWRLDSWMARLMGKRWHEYSPPSVLHWFTRSGLDTLMRRHSFSVMDSGKPKKYISAGHAASLLEHLLGSKIPVKLLRMLHPDAKIRYPSYDLEWRLYRRG
ncbi:bifunctional 2-polyprenyl-6-hydroxyphenol methylase/3-demethylubiquinol 3-O-methyltransferase UbiG [Ruegeria sp. HKCCA5426]|uniref:class I SAM-dependent methyltransferase n=1 Tax=Ruegeria sp. HKCCA5426 TaxID=2682985 RepID=UPI001487D97B|nr:class I SAM-dependent methyltransferase [Ruegeria sp. HKCCA5426]